MATACKLEMSLDEIIKANKSKATRSGPIGRKTQMVGKRINRGIVAKGKAVGRKQNTFKKVTPKRVGINARRIRPIRKVTRVGSAIAKRNVALKNQAVISATKNLVNKLVKKALSNPNVAALNPRRGKRLPPNRTRRSPRTIVLNKIGRRSRVIARQPPRIVAFQQQQPMIVQRVVRGRGPIHFASNSAIVPQATNIMPRRRPRLLNSVQQQPFVVVQQPPTPRVLPSFSSMSVRDHINALRRANTVQQLQSQFTNQQQAAQVHLFGGQRSVSTSAVPRRSQRKQFIVSEAVQPRSRFMQAPVIMQQQGPRRRLRQPTTQYVIVQQPSRPQRSQFRGRPLRSRRLQQSQDILNAVYEPPNFLQRIPANSGGFIQY